MSFVPFAPHEYVIKRLQELAPLERMIYFTGFLDEERHKSPTANAIAKVAYSLYESGLVVLSQKRVSPPITHTGMVSWVIGSGNGFQYIATGAIPKKRRWND